jgi:hypothetical protein
MQELLAVSGKEDPGGSRKIQGDPGGPRGIQKEDPGRFRKSQEEPENQAGPRSIKDSLAKPITSYGACMGP